MVRALQKESEDLTGSTQEPEVSRLMKNHLDLGAHPRPDYLQVRPSSNFPILSSSNDLLLPKLGQDRGLKTPLVIAVGQSVWVIKDSQI
jgi:hypothetical protein